MSPGKCTSIIRFVLSFKASAHHNKDISGAQWGPGSARVASRDEGQGHRPPCPAWRNPVLVQAGLRRGAVIRNPLPQTIGAAHQVFWDGL